MRAATIPITPGCQSSPASTYAGAPACSATSASASKRIRVSTSRRSRLIAVELVRDRPRAVLVGGQQQLEAGVGARHPPGRVDARRQAEADRRRVERAGIDCRDRHQRPQARAWRWPRGSSAPPAPAPGSRRRAGRRPPPSRARRDRGPRRPALDPDRRPPAAPRPGCRQRPSRTARGTGSRRSRGCTISASGNVPSARGV